MWQCKWSQLLQTLKCRSERMWQYSWKISVNLPVSESARWWCLKRTTDAKLKSSKDLRMKKTSRTGHGGRYTSCPASCCCSNQKPSLAWTFCKSSLLLWTHLNQTISCCLWWGSLSPRMSRCAGDRKHSHLGAGLFCLGWVHCVQRTPPPPPPLL